MSHATGSFIWYELVSPDPRAAAAFYAAVIGWHPHGFDGVDMDYTLFDAPDGTSVAGMAATSDSDATGWTGYVGVEDVDATTEQARAAGARIDVAPRDIPDVGRIAEITDRQGVSFFVMRGAREGESTAFAPHTPGHGGWNELHTTDWEDAWGFYQGLFGWAPARQMDMGPMGKYQLFQIHGVDAGAMFNNPAAPAWLFYFNVADLDAAAERVTANGGAVLNGPMDVPDGQRIVQCRDPQGAGFALVGPGVGPGTGA